MTVAPPQIDILLVEDDEDDYLFTKEYLDAIQGQTYNITWVTNYVDGLKTIAANHFDVTLVDYRIDTGTGLEFIRMTHARNIECPVILLTGVRSREVDIAAQQAGASDYLIKGSLNSEILERSIRYAMAHSERRRVLDSVLANIDAAVIALDRNDGVMLMNGEARSLVGLDDVGQYAPDNSIGIFSNVRRFLGEMPYPKTVYDAKGDEYGLKMTPLANDGKLIILRETARLRTATAQPAKPRAGDAPEEIELGLTPASTHALFSWMEKVLVASKQLTKQTGAASWQQFAAELRHSGRRLVHQVSELQKIGHSGDPSDAGNQMPPGTPVAQVTASASTPVVAAAQAAPVATTPAAQAVPNQPAAAPVAAQAAAPSASGAAPTLAQQAQVQQPQQPAPAVAASTPQVGTPQPATAQPNPTATQHVPPGPARG